MGVSRCNPALLWIAGDEQARDPQEQEKSKPTPYPGKDIPLLPVRVRDNRRQTGYRDPELPKNKVRGGSFRAKKMIESGWRETGSRHSAPYVLGASLTVAVFERSLSTLPNLV
jgi:hypothetical protein